MQAEIQNSFNTLGEAFRKHPFDFSKENDITTFLSTELKSVFPNRVSVALADGIERFSAFEDPNRMMCSRVGTEVAFLDNQGTYKFDVVVLEDRAQVVMPKTKRMAGRFEPPFLIGIEVKLSYGSRSARLNSIGGVVQDVAKLACLKRIFADCYVVIADFAEDRELSGVRRAVALLKGVGVFYAGLDRYELILP